MRINNTVKLERLKKEINQTEMARLCSVSRQTIHAIESGKYIPSVELALKIAKALQLSVESLFTLKRK